MKLYRFKVKSFQMNQCLDQKEDDQINQNVTAMTSCKFSKKMYFKSWKSSLFNRSNWNNQNKIPSHFSFCCYMCQELFPTSQALQKHFLLHDPEERQKFMCKSCDKNFTSANLLRSHMENVHERQKRNKKNYHDTICPICEEV